MKTTDSNSDVEKQLDPYLKLIEIFNSVHLRAKPREDILAWHHEQVKQARIDELKNLALAHWQKSVPEQSILDRIKELSKSKEE